VIRRCLALLLTPGVLLVGCGSPSSGNSGPSPGSAGSSASPVATAASSTPTSTSTPSPITPPSGLIRGGYAVLVTSLNAAPYTLRLVDITGQSLASARAAGRSPIRLGSIGNSAPAVFMPTVSASATRAYYLDGDSAVRSLTVDGKTSLVTQIPGSATVEAGFAVSPDNRRIAVSAINYGVSPPALRLYVENLGSGGNHSELLASSSLYVWPVAWQGSSLILAVGPATAICVPPATGQGVISAIGSLCGGPNDGVFLQRWDENRKPIPERLQSAFAEWDVRGLRWWQRDCHNRANLDLDDQQRSWNADRGVGLGSPWMGGR